MKADMTTSEQGAQQVHRSTRLSRIVNELDAYMPYVLHGRAPGLSLAIYDGHTDEVFSAGYGFADLASQTPMTAETVTRASSISKIYVSTAVMQLVESGDLDPYAPVNEYIRDFSIRNPLGPRPVTTFDLLKYRAGLCLNLFDMRSSDSTSLHDYLVSMYARQRGSEYGGKGRLWTRRVDEEIAYTSLGMATLGHLVAEANPHGYSYEEYVEKNIFGRLGMPSSCVSELHAEDGATELLGRCSTGYMQFGSRCVRSPILRSPAYPATSLLTTADDHLCWLVAMLHKGRARNGRLLAPHVAEEMLIPQSEFRVGGQPSGLWYGLGVQMANLGQRDYWFGHAGGYPFGWWSESRAYPHLGFAVVAFSNAWDMARMFNPPNRTAYGLAVNFVAALMADEERVVRAPVDRAFGVSYALGLQVADSVALAGATDALDPVSVEAMIESTRCLPGAEPDLWDPRGFRAGIQALNRGELTGEAIREFLASDATVSIDYLDLFALDWGASSATWPGPMPYFADRVEENPAIYRHLDALG